MAAYVGVGHAAALTAGTAALHLAVKLAGVKPGDKVSCSDLTFFATVNPVCYEGGERESERETWNMDPRALEAENIESRPIWKPMHMQPVFTHNDFIHVGDLVGEDIFARGICLPSDIKNTKEDMERIIRVVRGLF